MVWEDISLDKHKEKHKVKIMSHAYLLQENGHQIQLEQQANAFLILESSDDVGIHLTGQPHATQAFYGSRPEQLIDIQFIFKLKSCLITKTGLKMCIRSVLKRPVTESIKLKSILLRETKNSLKVKSTLMVKEVTKLFLASSLLKTESYKVGIFAMAEGKNIKKNKIRKLLLRKLKELWDKDE
jgi:hypothetical protein